MPTARSRAALWTVEAVIYYEKYLAQHSAEEQNSNMDIHPSVATAALSLINSTVQTAKTAVELAKNSKNSSLKETVGEVLDGILDLKIKVIELEEENRELKLKLSNKEALERKGEFGYWFKVGEDAPLCPKCYEGDGKLVYLPKPEPWSGGIRRDCRVCRYTTWEQPMDLSPKPIRPIIPRF